MNSIKKLILILFLTLTQIGCSDNPTSAPIDYNRLESVSITEKIVLSSSDFIIADSVKENVFSIDFGKTKTFLEGKTSDISITYITSSSCDQDLFIFNYKKSKWRQLGFLPDVGVCFDAFTTQSHLLSTNNFFTKNFINSEGKVLIRYDTGHYQIGGIILKLSSDYLESSAPLNRLGKSTSKLDFDENSIWYFTYRDQIFRKKSLDGRILNSINAHSERVSAFTVDKETIWFIEQEGKVIGLDSDTGDENCRFQSTALFPQGLTTDNKDLWIAFNTSTKSRLHSYDLVKSCETGVGVLLKDIEFSDTYVLDLDWDGSNLLVLDDNLNIVNTEGMLLTAYSLEVNETRQVIWDGEAALLIHLGPSQPSNESIITRFLLN